MTAPILRTSGARMLRPRPDALAAYDEVQPYKPPLRNLKVIESTAPRIEEARWNPLDPGYRGWGRQLGWLEALDVPRELVAAKDAYLTLRTESFEPHPDLTKLGVPSLVREARAEWRREHTHRRREALRSVALTLLACGPTLYEQCAKGLAKAIENRDDAAYQLWAKTAAKVRGSGIVGAIVGDGGKPSPVKLSSGAVEWLVAHPDLLHDLDVRLSASVCADHPELEPGCYLPGEVLAHLAALGYR